MSKFLLDIPVELHDKLRHAKIETQTDIQDLIISALEEHYGD